jgi:hypothetical protein
LVSNVSSVVSAMPRRFFRVESWVRSIGIWDL